MAINLTNDFRTKGRIYGEKGAYFEKGITGIGIDTNGRILSGGIDLLTIFSAAISGSTGDSMLTFGGNLTGAVAYKPTAGPVTVGVSFNPTFGTVNATTFTGALNGNASTASTWANSRTFTFAGGNVTGAFSTDGSASVSNISLNILSVSSTRWDSVYSTYNAYSGQFITSLGPAGTQGQIEVYRIYSEMESFDLTNLGTTGSPTFANILISNNATVAGNLSVAGNLTFLDTQVTLTSALSVVNAGTGPALYVEQLGVQPLAQFVDREGGRILFNNNATVSIGTNTSTQALNVGGNILASNITLSGLPVNTSTDSIVVSGTGGTLGARNANNKIWGTSLIEGTMTSGRIPKASGTNSLSDSILSDDGISVSITNNAYWMTLPELRINNSGGYHTRRDTFVGIANISGDRIATFTKTNLQSVSMTVTLIQGTTSHTVFNILGTGNTGLDIIKGTVYGIVDGTATSQLVDADLISTGSNIFLAISSVSNTTNVVIDGTAVYSGATT